MAEPRHFYLTPDGAVVEEVTEGSGIQVHVEGQDVNEAQLNEYGPNVAKDLKALLSKKTAESKEEKAAPSTKDVKGPEENKAG